MSQNFATDAVGQVPEVTSPDLLNVKIMNKLTAHRLYRATQLLTFSKLIRPQLGWLTILRWHRKLKSLFFKKFSVKRFRQISTIAQENPFVAFGKFTEHANVMDICWGHIERLNHAKRVDFDMEAKPIKGLIAHLLAIGCNPLEELAESRSCESADRDREAVYNAHNIRKSLCNMFEELFLDAAEVCCVSYKTYAAGKRGEIVAVEISKKSEDVFIGVKTENFAYDFQGKYFAVRHLRHRTSASQCSFWKEIFHKIISLAEDIYDKIIKVHCTALHDQWNNFCSLSIYSIGQRAFLISVRC